MEKPWFEHATQNSLRACGEFLYQDLQTNSNLKVKGGWREFSRKINCLFMRQVFSAFLHMQPWHFPGASERLWNRRESPTSHTTFLSTQSGWRDSGACLDFTFYSRLSSGRSCRSAASDWWFHFRKCIWISFAQKTTRMGFEPTRAEPIGLAVQRLNHSATSSVAHFGRLNDITDASIRVVNTTAFTDQSINQ